MGDAIWTTWKPGGPPHEKGAVKKNPKKKA
jgi:hypothetical protein